MLLVSFCDIVTIVICAMFMAMIVVIDVASKIPVVSPIPVLKGLTNGPVYFECRNNMIFPIDVTGLAEIFSKESAVYSQNVGQGRLEKLMAMDVGDKFYRVDPGLASLGILGLRPRPNIIGVASNDLIAAETAAKAAAAQAQIDAAAAGHGGGGGGHAKDDHTPTSGEDLSKDQNPFTTVLGSMDKKAHYCVFFVRDSGFDIYKQARALVLKLKYKQGWEYLDEDEAITFEGMMTHPGRQ